MRGKRKSTKKPAENLADKMKKIEATFENIKSELKETKSCLLALTERGEELEQRVSFQMIDLQNQIREKMATGANPDAFITLEEGDAVNLEELEKRMEEKYSLLAAREVELQDLQKRILEEFENLRAEIKERDLFLTAREVDIKNFKQTMGVRIEELEILLKKQVGDRGRRTRMLSFLVDIGKKS